MYLADNGDISDNNIPNETRRIEHIPRRDLAKKEIHRLITTEAEAQWICSKSVEFRKAIV